MWFDPYAALAEMHSEGVENTGSQSVQDNLGKTSDGSDVLPTTSAKLQTDTPRPGNNVQALRDNQDLGAPPELQSRQPVAVETSTRVENFPYGHSVGGRPLTWTGKVVSLDAWRQLSEWERHGPRGRVWNGKSKQWEQEQ